MRDASRGLSRERLTVLLARLRDSREVDRSSLMPCALPQMPSPLLLLSGPESPLRTEDALSLLSEPLLHLQ